MRRAGAEDRRRVERRAVHAVARTAPRARRRKARWCSRAGSAARTGAAPPSIRDRVRVRRHTGRRRARLDGEDEGRIAGALRQDDARPRHVRRPDRGTRRWPCQKPPWGRLTAINPSTGDFAWQVPLGITEQLPPGKQNTGRPVLAGPIVTASGLLFIASTDDNRFRALEPKTGKRAVGHETRAARQRQPDHLRVEQRQAVRRRSSRPIR